MKLNYLLKGQGTPIVLIHGLFGSLDNLGVLARDLSQDHQVLQIDLRNHGLSPHSEDMNYAVMADDLIQLFDTLSLERLTVIGHSMGGKVAMRLTAERPELIERLIVIDIAPVAYPERRHDDVFAALQAVSENQVTERAAAAELMSRYIKQDGVIQFLLKSFRKGEWLFNIPALYRHYDEISGWQSVPAWRKPTLFIRGQLSPYISRNYWNEIAAQFPQAKAHVIAGAGHWVHGEKPEATLRTIRRFLEEPLDDVG
jgi:esterase